MIDEIRKSLEEITPGPWNANMPTYIKYLLEQVERLEKERDAAAGSVGVALYGKVYHLRTTTVSVTENVGAKSTTYKSKHFPKRKQLRKDRAMAKDIMVVGNIHDKESE